MNRLPDYLDHMHQAVVNACAFTEGMSKDEFLTDRRTQQAVVMSLIIIGEAVTKIIDHHASFAAICVRCVIAWLMATLISISALCGTL